jgi:hypothetical protein
MKIRSESELENHIDKEFSWRRKELTNFYNAAFTSRAAIRNTHLKLLVVLLYSHWEGFIKSTSVAYCEFLNGKGIKYSELKDSFKVYCILNKFNGTFPSTKFSSYIEAITVLNHDLDEKLRINTELYINTQSNLKSAVLKDIVQKLGLDYIAEYELREQLIDQRFVVLRNAIAHGENREVDEATVKDLYEEITNLIDCFKNQMLNSVWNKSYLYDKHL